MANGKRQTAKIRSRPGETDLEKKGGVYMGYDGTKLVYFDGKPQWLMPDGSFLPEKRRNDEMFSPGSLYLKDRALGESRLIIG
jgi:hypothetical protein